jgi:hypothetical protein
VRWVQEERPPEATAFALPDEPIVRNDSGLDDDLLLDDIPAPVESGDTGDFALEDDHDEAAPQDTGETAILSLDELDAPDDPEAPDEPEARVDAEPVDEEPAAEETRGEAEAPPKGDPVSCTACDAMGSCRRCGGRGRRFGRRCPDCNGSGTCSVCGGPGYIWVEEPVAQRAG